MGSLGDGVKKVLLAGIGTAAVTVEKSKEVLDKMAERGEAAVEQGKVLNQELRHNIKKTVKENVNVSVKTSSPEELDELLDKMTPEQMKEAVAYNSVDHGADACAYYCTDSTLDSLFR